MKRHNRIQRIKSGPNVSGKQRKDAKTSPGSSGTNHPNASMAKVAQAFLRFLTNK